MAFCNKYFIIFMAIYFMAVIQKTYSQTVWLDIDTGKIVGVSPPKGTQNQPQYPQQNYGPYRRHDNGRSHNIYNENYNNGMRYPQQTGNNYMRDDPRFGKTLTTEWVCRSSKTGDTMVIDNEIMVSKFPEQLQPNYNQQQEYDRNPWLNNQNNNNNNNDHNYQKQPQTTTQRNWSIDRDSVTNNYNPTITPKLTTISQPETLPPIISTTKKPFPSLDNIDWTKYIEDTTKAGGSTPTSLDRAVNGEGVISPRQATFD
ncbi:GATA zinc finger domain-containing protein 14-like [Chelonus insularis]|uniref:GATA zinc finger domain-containing protein 14-like n=1 Tax=Chelonus insularis TaxID=460826 RepID=UPI00158D6E94|nr:GATA zinc finger domain-containing protein 14-like [Chelonus insularis]